MSFFELGLVGGKIRLRHLVTAIGLAWCQQAAMAAEPAIFLDQSSVIGIGDTITALGVPVKTANGKFICLDVTISLVADPKGKLGWATGKPGVQACPPLQVSNIRPGIYVNPANSAEGIKITGPTPIGNGGVAEWTITIPPNKTVGLSPPNPAVFYTGPLAQSPLAQRLKKVGLTSTQYSYGVIGTSNVANGAWATNGLFGLRLVNDQLVVASFTDDGVDQRVPVTQIIYTLTN